MAIKLFSILNFVRKQMMKTDDDGIMRLPSELKAKYGEAVITKQLIDAGVDPRTIKNEQQLINVLDSIDAMKTQRTTKPGTTSGIRNAESAKVFSIIDKKQIPNPEKNIMGGQAFETEEEIAERIAKQNKESVKKFKEKMKEDPEDMADGGRIGFKKGMDRRTFMKIMGGLTALPVLGKFFKGAEVAAPVAEKAVQAAKGVPPYFFDLVNKIKIFGKQRQTPSYKERVNEYTYTGNDGIEYELVEDLDTGEIMIKKDKMGVASSGDQSYDVIEDRTEMVFKKGRADETTKGTPVDEYEEYKVEFDADGTAADATDVDEISKSEIIKEVSADTPAIKKAGGGIARMLGE